MNFNALGACATRLLFVASCTRCTFAGSRHETTARPPALMVVETRPQRTFACSTEPQDARDVTRFAKCGPHELRPRARAPVCNVALARAELLARSGRRNEFVRTSERCFSLGPAHCETLRASKMLELCAMSRALSFSELIPRSLACHIARAERKSLCTFTSLYMRTSHYDPWLWGGQMTRRPHTRVQFDAT